MSMVPPAHAFLPLVFGAGRIGSFIGAAIPSGMRAGGYAARDPRMATTVAAIGKGLAGRMTSMGKSITSLPWGKTAVYSGIGVVGGVGGSYALVEGLNWIMTDNPETVQVEQAGGESSSLPLVNSYTSRKEFLEGQSTGVHWANVSTSPEPRITRLQIFHVPCVNTSGTCSISGLFPFTESKVDGPMTGPYVTGGDAWSKVASFAYTADAENRHQKQLWEFTPAGGYVDEQPPVVIEKPIDVAMEQVASLPDEQLDQPLSDVWLAGLANSAHRSATLELDQQPGYWPWAPSQPLVKPADVSKVFADNPALVRPTVRDLTEAIAPPAATTVPLPMPEKYLPATDGGVPPPPVLPGNADGTEINWGDDPNVGAPGLEAIPTAQQILEPLMSVYPELREATFGMSAGTCPVGEFNIFDSQYVMDQHCVLLEQNRAGIALSMALGWSILSLVIVLRA